MMTEKDLLPVLQSIADSLQRLAPPKWPEEVFGKIDRSKALAGKALFASHCAGCHNAWPYTWSEPNKYGKRFLEVGMVPQKYVGTDPGQFNIAHNIATDEDGWVYVADRENHRVQVFDGNGKYELQWNNMHRPCALYCCAGGGKNPKFIIGELGPPESG